MLGLAGVALLLLPGCAILPDPEVPEHISGMLRLESATCYIVYERETRDSVQRELVQVENIEMAGYQGTVIVGDLGIEEMSHSWSNGSSTVEIGITIHSTEGMTLGPTSAELFVTQIWGDRTPVTDSWVAFRRSDSFKDRIRWDTGSWIAHRADFENETRWCPRPARAFIRNMELGISIDGDIYVSLQPGDKMPFTLHFPIERYTAADVVIPYHRSSDDVKGFLVLTYTLDSTIPKKYMKAAIGRTK